MSGRTARLSSLQLLQAWAWQCDSIVDPSCYIGQRVSWLVVYSCIVSAGLTVAEHFRDAEGQDVLLFIDNIFRFTQVCLLCHLICLSYNSMNGMHELCSISLLSSELLVCIYRADFLTHCMLGA